MESTTNTLTFKVTRQEPELIPPAKPTPHDFKRLSDIDDQEGLRFQIPIMLFYPKCPYVDSKDPIKVIREAIAKALVSYYPFAGRIREGPARKLVVECTGEGVMFIEADADVTLKDDALKPPFPCLKELLYEVPGSGGVLNCPLLRIQVTRLKCGGFIFALSLNHTMGDAVGIVRFMSTVGEIARGAKTPLIPPVWERHLLDAQDPPHVTHTHREYDVVPDTSGTLTPRGNMVRRSFFFGAADISALRRGLPSHLKSCSIFEILTACLWRCRTIAISADPDEEVRVTCIVNARNRFNPPLPIGYYGNVIAYPVAISIAKDLCEKPLHYALDLVMKTKSSVTEEYMKSLANLMVIRGRPPLTVARNYVVSDLTRAGFDDVDFGWGKPGYVRIGNCDVGEIPSISTFYIPFKNKGENGLVAPIWLPADAMAVFVKELEMMLKKDDDLVVINQYPVSVKSAL